MGGTLGGVRVPQVDLRPPGGVAGALHRRVGLHADTPGAAGAPGGSGKGGVCFLGRHPRRPCGVWLDRDGRRARKSGALRGHAASGGGERPRVHHRSSGATGVRRLRRTEGGELAGTTGGVCRGQHERPGLAQHTRATKPSRPPAAAGAGVPGASRFLGAGGLRKDLPQ